MTDALTLIGMGLAVLIVLCLPRRPRPVIGARIRLSPQNEPMEE